MGSSSWIERVKFSFTGLVVYFCLVLFFPYLKIGGRDNFEITFAVTLLFAIFLPRVYKEFKSRKKNILNTILVILVIVFIMDSISIVNFIMNKGFDNIISNIVPNIKVVLYILILSAFYKIDDESNIPHKFLYNVLPVIGGILALIGILQYFNILGINDWFTRFYISGEGGQTLIEVLNDKQQFGRVLGTLSNPNFFSLELIIFFILVITGIKSSSLLLSKIKYSLIALLLFAAIVLTQSRTALIILIFICFYIMLIQIIRGGIKNAIKYGCVILGTVVLAFLIAKAMNLYYLLDALQNGLKTHTLTMRFDRWKDALELFKLHPIVGIGPVIGTYFPAVDNEYFHILRNYGVLGLIAHVSFYLFVFAVSFKDMFSKTKNALSRQYALVVNCSILAVMIANITMATFYLWRNFVLILLICGLWAVIRNMDNELKSLNK